MSSERVLSLRATLLAAMYCWSVRLPVECSARSVNAAHSLSSTACLPLATGQEEKTANGNGEQKKTKKQPWEPWEKSRAKQWLKKWFRDGSIPVEYSKTEGGLGPRKYWDELCAGHPDFGGVGMQYNDAFTKRLGAAKKDFGKKEKRANIDQASFDNYRLNHPEEVREVE
jgi:hypothetical protein